MVTDRDLEADRDPVTVRDWSDVELLAISDHEVGELPAAQLGLEEGDTLAISVKGTEEFVIQHVDPELPEEDEEVDDADD